METFEHSHLEVYQLALKIVGLVDRIARSLPPVWRHLADQLRRASSSIVLNTAEGAGEYAPLEKARFYRIARRSATECASGVEICCALALADAELLRVVHSNLKRVVVILTAFVRRLSRTPGPQP